MSGSLVGPAGCWLSLYGEEGPHVLQGAGQAGRGKAGQQGGAVAGGGQGAVAHGQNPPVGLGAARGAGGVLGGAGGGREPPLAEPGGAPGLDPPAALGKQGVV